eukprot:Awhi_evm1s727
MNSLFLYKESFQWKILPWIKLSSTTAATPPTLTNSITSLHNINKKSERCNDDDDESDVSDISSNEYKKTNKQERTRKSSFNFLRKKRFSSFSTSKNRKGKLKCDSMSEFSRQKKVIEAHEQLHDQSDSVIRKPPLRRKSTATCGEEDQNRYKCSGNFEGCFSTICNRSEKRLYKNDSIQSDFECPLCVEIYNNQTMNPSRKIKFVHEVEELTTYSKAVYGRANTQLAKYNTPEEKQKIRKELIEYKTNDMEIHPSSISNNNLHDYGKRKTYLRNRLKDLRVIELEEELAKQRETVMKFRIAKDAQREKERIARMERAMIHRLEQESTDGDQEPRKHCTEMKDKKIDLLNLSMNSRIPQPC